MKIPLIIFFTIFYSCLHCQKCENFIQNIDMNGHFNIFTMTENSYLRDLKNEVETIHPKKNINKIDLKEFQQKFPQFYDGKCLLINDENFASSSFKFCDKNFKNEIDQKSPVLYGSFSIDSSLDEFYIIKFFGFEIGGFLIFDSKTKKVYGFGNEPIFSKDKKFIFGYTNDYYQGFQLSIKEIGYERSLSYRLHGRYEIKEIKLVQFENLNKELLINLDEIIERDENYNLIEKKTCNLRLGIN